MREEMIIATYLELVTGRVVVQDDEFEKDRFIPGILGVFSEKILWRLIK